MSTNASTNPTILANPAGNAAKKITTTLTKPLVGNELGESFGTVAGNFIEGAVNKIEGMANAVTKAQIDASKIVLKSIFDVFTPRPTTNQPVQQSQSARPNAQQTEQQPQSARRNTQLVQQPQSARRNMQQTEQQTVRQSQSPQLIAQQTEQQSQYPPPPVQPDQQSQSATPNTQPVQQSQSPIQIIINEINNQIQTVTEFISALTNINSSELNNNKKKKRNENIDLFKKIIEILEKIKKQINESNGKKAIQLNNNETIITKKQINTIRESLANTNAKAIFDILFPKKEEEEEGEEEGEEEEEEGEEEGEEETKEEEEEKREEEVKKIANK